VIHREQDRRLAFCGRKSRGHIGAPHVIDPGGGDGAVMGSGPRATAPAVRRQELVFPHQPEPAPFRGPDTGV